MGGEAAVDSHSAKKQRNFNGFQEVMPTDDGRGRQFVSQLGALAVGESLRANSLSFILLIYNGSFSKVFRANVAKHGRQL